MSAHDPKFEPSPEEIRELCREIQQGWSQHDFEKRSTVKRRRWSVPNMERIAGPADVVEKKLAE